MYISKYTVSLSSCVRVCSPLLSLQCQPSRCLEPSPLLAGLISSGIGWPILGAALSGQTMSLCCRKGGVTWFGHVFHPGFEDILQSGYFVMVRTNSASADKSATSTFPLSSNYPNLKDMSSAEVCSSGPRSTIDWQPMKEPSSSSCPWAKVQASPLVHLFSWRIAGQHPCHPVPQGWQKSLLQGPQGSRFFPMCSLFWDGLKICN